MQVFTRHLRQLQLQGRSAFALFAVFLATAVVFTPWAGQVESAPATQLGPVESTSGTVVAVGGGTFQLERPALSNPSQLEQVTSQAPAGVSVQTCDIVSMVGRYNISSKVFVADSLTKVGNSCPRAAPVSSSSDDDNDNGGGDDDDDDDDEDDDDEDNRGNSDTDDEDDDQDDDDND